MLRSYDKISERAKLLAKTPLFEGLQEHEFKVLAGRMHERPMRANEVLFRRNDPGASLVIILAGEVRVVLSDVDGRDQVLKLLRPGDIFGEIALLDNGLRSADVIAESSGRLLMLERRDLLKIFSMNGELALRVIALLCSRLRSMTLLLETMLFHDVSQRLASTILELSGRQPGRRLNITQRALGEFVGATRETVNKKLREWQEAGFIAVEPGRVTVINPTSLDFGPKRDVVGLVETAALPPVTRASPTSVPSCAALLQESANRA